MRDFYMEKKRNKRISLRQFRRAISFYERYLDKVFFRALKRKQNVTKTTSYFKNALKKAMKAGNAEDLDSEYFDIVVKSEFDCEEGFVLQEKLANLYVYLYTVKYNCNFFVGEDQAFPGTAGQFLENIQLQE